VVYIVGAGPGDPGLLTRRGAELLGLADVVAYDRLVHPELLKLAPQAELLDVGKRPGESGKGQARINELLVSEAQEGKKVVRLKGGDPFVFGRGGEEAEVLAAAGIRFEIVPGVTSAVAGPAYAGIPLTHRDHASWAVIATGHEAAAAGGSGVFPDETGASGVSSDRKSSDENLDWVSISKAPSAVFLMGIERLPQIVSRLQEHGKDADTPVAVVASATLPQQRVLRSTLEKVVSEVQSEGVRPPAVLVVGPTASLDLDWVSTRPLAGKRVFVTRTRAQAGRLSLLLSELGAEVAEHPAIAITPPSSFEPLDRSLDGLDAFAWVIFTSANAVDSFWERLHHSGLDARALASVRVAAVGPSTAADLRARGIEPDLLPEVFTSEALAEAMGSPDNSSETDVLIPHSESAPDGMVRTLQHNGWRCEVVPAYDTVTDTASVDSGRSALETGVDAVLFTSGSTVRSFVELWGKPPAGALVCCIGPRTAEAAAECGQDQLVAVLQFVLPVVQAERNGRRGGISVLVDIDHNLIAAKPHSSGSCINNTKICLMRHQPI
jgi:uroporphyrinogen III methyltransferase / synthase